MSSKMKVFWGVLIFAALLIIIVSAMEFLQGLVKTVVTVLAVIIGIIVLALVVRMILKLIKK